MNGWNILKVQAGLMGLLALLLAVCAATARFGGDGATVARAFWATAAGALVLGAAEAGLVRAVRRRRTMLPPLTRRDGLAAVASGWLAAGLVASLPYALSGATGWGDAVFEAYSGITTTGVTVLTGLDAQPKAILLWRSLTQFLGGMGVLFLMVAILPLAGAGGMQLFRAEMPGPTKDKFAPRMADMAQRTWGLYVGGALVLFVLLWGSAPWVEGMTWLDAACLAMSTLSTGGFVTHDAGLAYWSGQWVRGVVCLFMVLASVSFARHYLALRSPAAWWRSSNTETRFFLALLAVGAVALMVGGAFGRGARGICGAVFASANFISTTGYDGWNRVPAWAGAWLTGLALIGGCAGGTAGGMKAGRVLLVFKAVAREIRRFMQPQAVIPVRLDRTPVKDDALLPMLAFAVLYLAALGAGTVALLPYAGDAGASFSASASLLTNVGNGFGGGAEAGFWVAMPAVGKSMAIFLMLAGRLELLSFLTLFLPSFWRT